MARGHADVIADAHYLPFRASSFEGCFAFSSLEHVDNPRKVLEEIYFALKLYSCLHILVPTDSKLKLDYLQKLLNFNLKGIPIQYKALRSGEHKWQFSEKNLKQILVNAGFVVEKVEYPRIPLIYGRKGKIIAKLGFVRYPHLLIHAKRSNSN